MQTFLPYPSFEESARVLDYRRLGKQRVECLQILTALRDGGAWANHPATRMWRGAESGLCLYALIICEEWIRRGYKDTCHGKIATLYAHWKSAPHGIGYVTLPTWLGNEDFHRAHRANLVRKAPEFYTPLFGALLPEPYVWPEGKDVRL